jgi:pSer/pThr/pTyr-binding forkhead associated (FHA) protein
VDVILVHVKQDGRSQEIPVRRSPLVIGRREGAGLQIPDAGISREHCELVIEEDAVLIRDLNSSNGTFVNATRVKEAELAPGDLVAIGAQVFAVRIDGFPKLIDPSSAFLEGTPPPPAPSAAPPPSKARPAGSPAAAPAIADSDDSGELDFDFLNDDDEDEQPKL